MKKLYFITSILLLSILTFAQKTPKDSLKDIPTAINASDIQKLLPQNTVKSPNVASLERFGNYPVNMYSGLPNIEIPLYDIKIGNLVIPIKLAYHASGNKVSDNASYVGLGWSLIGDYVISRNVRGLADESDFSNNNSLLQKNLQTLPQSTNTICLTAQLKADFAEYINGSKDAERDIFTYHTPKKSNSFVILPNQTGVIWQESDKSIFSYSGALQNLSVLDEDGVKYLYETPETTVMPSSGTGSISAWHLKEIQGVKATDKIKFSYQLNNQFNFTGDIVDSEVYNTDIVGRDATTIPGGFQGNFNTPNTPGVTPQLLKEIIFPTGKIVFVLSTADRQDNLGKSLEAVEIYGFNVSTNQYVLQKKFTFTYIYKQRSNTYTGNVVMFLDKVNLVNTSNTILGSYRFDYKTLALPAAASNAKDFWGYYNAQTQNTTLIPPLTYTGLVYSTQQTFQIGGANREVNALAADAWMLNRIFYPTGGYTTFEYECNRYLDANNTMQLAGGQRIKSIVSNDNTGVTTTKTYKYGIGESGNGTLRSQAFKFFSTVQRIKLFDFSGGSNPDYQYTVRTFSSANTLAANPNEGSPVTYPVVTEYEDTGTGANGKTIYTFKDDIFDNLITLLTNGKSAQISRHWNRGQLLNKVTYGFDGKKKYEQNNTYSTITSGVSAIVGYLVGQSEISLNQPNYNSQGCLQNGDNFNAIEIKWDYGLVKQISSTEKYYDNQDDTKFSTKKSETTFSPIHYQPTEMKEYVSNSIVLGKLLWYAQDFTTVSTTATVTDEVKALRSLQQRNILTSVIEEIDYRKDLLAPPPPDAPLLQITGGKFMTFEALSTSGIEKAIVPKTVSLTECLWNTFLNGDNTGNFTPAVGLFNPASNTSTIPRNINHKTRIYFDTYDADGNLTTFHQSDGATTKYVYSTATNDGLSFVYPTSEIQNYVSPNPQGLKALTTNYSFTIPLLGMDSMTDPSGLKTYFEYDTFSRLLQIKDHNSKIVKKYQYQY